MRTAFLAFLTGCSVFTGAALSLQRKVDDHRSAAPDVSEAVSSDELAAAKAVAKLAWQVSGKSNGLASSALEDRDTPSVEPRGLPGGMTEAQHRKLLSIQTMVWVLGSYHKTGTELSLSMIRAFHGKSNVSWTGVELQHQSTEVFSTEPFRNFYFNPNIEVVHTIPRYRFVHFVRDPFNIIISAYRYHMEALEKWLLVPVWQAISSNLVDKDLTQMQLWRPYLSDTHREALNQYRHAVVDNKMTLVDYYHSAPARDGIIVEALRSWPEIELLMRNYNATRQDSRTLQVHMESIQASFPKSMQCMFEFLAQSAELNVEQAMMKVSGLDVSKHPRRAGGGPGHVTSGRYDNTHLEDILAQVQPLNTARSVLTLPAVNEC